MGSPFADSLWLATSPRAYDLTPVEPVAVDVIVVGGGIAGLTAATILKRAGATVALVEMHRVGFGETGHTTAHLTELVDTRYGKIVRDHGLDAAKAVAASSRAAIDHIGQWAAEFPCAFERVPGYLYTEDPEQVSSLEREVEAATAAGVQASLTREVPLPFPTAAGIRVEGQAQFHPMAYLTGLSRAFPGRGCVIFEAAQVTEVHDGDPCRVKLASGVELSARTVLVTAHVPIVNKLFLHTKLAAYRTYAMAVRGARLPPPGLYWDTADPYHYTRLHSDSRGPLLIVGGEDHKTGQSDDTEAAYARLADYIASRFGTFDPAYRWSGQVIEPADGLPYIGRNSMCENVFVATGFSGNGMTFGTLAGMMLADAVLDRTNPWTDLYQATRMKVIGAMKAMITENVDFPRHLIGDRLEAPHHAITQIPPGEGEVVMVGGRKLAVYRDERGVPRGFNPACTHMGCHVHWNTAEKSWDCPCHGGRFDAFGQVLNGPPVAALEPRDLDEPNPDEEPVPIGPQFQVGV